MAKESSSQLDPNSASGVCDMVTIVSKGRLLLLSNKNLMSVVIWGRMKDKNKIK